MKTWNFTCLVIGRPVVIEGYGKTLADAKSDVIRVLTRIYEVDAEDIEIEKASRANRNLSKREERALAAELAYETRKSA